MENPHDSFVRGTLSDPEMAAPFLQAVLPDELTDSIDWPGLKLEKDSLVSGKLKNYYSDLLFSCPLKDASSMKVYLLFEHKSYPDAGVSDQMLRYLSELYIKMETKEPILPVLFYHGRSWRPPVEYHELFDFSQLPAAREFTLNFSILFIDVGKLNLEPLRAHLPLFAFAKALLLPSDIDESALASFLQEIHELFVLDKPTHWLYMLFRYVYARTDYKPEEIQEIASKVNHRVEEYVMTTLERVLAEGIEKGKREGKLEGKLEGKREGQFEARLATARRMKEKGYLIEDILEVTDLTREELEREGIVQKTAD